MKAGSTGGIGVSTVLLIIFIVLKLTGNIDWSWLWVLSPLWIPLSLVLIIFIIGLIVVKRNEKLRRKYAEESSDDTESEFDEF